MYIFLDVVHVGERVLELTSKGVQDVLVLEHGALLVGLVYLQAARLLGAAEADDAVGLVLVGLDEAFDVLAFLDHNALVLLESSEVLDEVLRFLVLEYDCVDASEVVVEFVALVGGLAYEVSALLVLALEVVFHVVDAIELELLE